MGGFAWVTLATNDSYSLGALVLAHSLRRVNTSHQLAVLITPAVSQSMKEQLQTVFDVVKVVDVLDSKDETNLALLKRPELGVTFTKIHCWKLTEFEKCVFLDADTLVVRNCDELFEREELSAAPDVGWPDCFNTGVFVYKPAVETFNNLVKLAVEQGSFDGGDQGLLNQYFSDWATSDIKKHLPFVYNLTSVAVYSYIPAFKHYGSQIRIVHFIGAIKPWLAELDPATRTISPAPGSEHLTPLLQNWWDIFVEKVHPAMSKELECASGMLNLQEPACSNSIALETSDQPGIPEPYKPYTEKDDSRQINLPYHPYEVTSSSGESLTAQFLQIREQEILEKQRREQEWWEEEQRRIQEEQKRVQEEKEREEKERQEQSGINEQSDDKHDDEPEPQTEMKEPEQHNEPEHHEQHHHEVHHSHFDYNTFYPDESCINTYLDQNAAFYQPFDSHHKSFEPLPVNNENPFQPEPEQTSHTLPRFLTIPEDDQRQSFHVQEWHPPPPPPQEEHHHQEWHYVPPSIPAPCYQMSTSHENLHVEENAAEVDLQKSKSMTNLAEATGNAMTGNFWKSQPNVNVDANKKYVMPKLKPLLPKVVSTPQPPTPVYEARPKITQYTEFHMSSDYKDPVKLPSDNMGFVERQILKEKRTKINKDAQVSKKFGALPYIEPMEPYVPQQTPPKQKTPLKEIDFNDVIDYDLSSCVRQSGNKPLPQEKKLKKENTLVYLPDLKPLVPADDKREQFKKRKSDERLQVPEDGRRKKRDSRKARERKRKEEVRKPVVTEVYKHTTDVQEILKRLMNYTKDYQDYFKEPEEKVDKRKTPSPTILINGKELEGGFSPIEAYPPADFENGFDESIFVSDFMKTSSGFKGGKDEIKKPKAIKAKKVKRGVEGLVGSEEIVEESIVRDVGRGTKPEVESREETIEEELRIGKLSAGMLEAGISLEKEQEITQSEPETAEDTIGETEVETRVEEPETNKSEDAVDKLQSGTSKEVPETGEQESIEEQTVEQTLSAVEDEIIDQNEEILDEKVVEELIVQENAGMVESEESAVVETEISDQNVEESLVQGIANIEMKENVTEESETHEPEELKVKDVTKRIEIGVVEPEIVKESKIIKVESPLEELSSSIEIAEEADEDICSPQLEIPILKSDIVAQKRVETEKKDEDFNIPEVKNATKTEVSQLPENEIKDQIELSSSEILVKEASEEMISDVEEKATESESGIVAFENVESECKDEAEQLEVPQQFANEIEGQTKTSSSEILAKQSSEDAISGLIEEVATRENVESECKDEDALPEVQQQPDNDKIDASSSVILAKESNEEAAHVVLPEIVPSGIVEPECKLEAAMAEVEDSIVSLDQIKIPDVSIGSISLPKLDEDVTDEDDSFLSNVPHSAKEVTSERSSEPEQPKIDHDDKDRTEPRRKPSEEPFKHFRSFVKEQIETSQKGLLGIQEFTPSLPSKTFASGIVISHAIPHQDKQVPTIPLEEPTLIEEPQVQVQIPEQNQDSDSGVSTDGTENINKSPRYELSPELKDAVPEEPEKSWTSWADESSEITKSVAEMVLNEPEEAVMETSKPLTYAVVAQKTPNLPVPTSSSSPRKSLFAIPTAQKSQKHSSKKSSQYRKPKPSQEKIEPVVVDVAQKVKASQKKVVEKVSEEVKKPANIFEVLPEESPDESVNSSVTKKSTKSKKNPKIVASKTKLAPSANSSSTSHVNIDDEDVHRDESDTLIADPNDNTGIAGAIANLSLESGTEKTETSPATSSAQDEYLRRQNWETGRIDYLGRDSFDNIWSKICETLDKKEPESAESPETQTNNEAPNLVSTASIQLSQPQEEPRLTENVEITEYDPRGPVSLSMILNDQPSDQSSEVEYIETLPPDNAGIVNTDEDDIIFLKSADRHLYLSNIEEESPEDVKESSQEVSQVDGKVSGEGGGVGPERLDVLCTGVIESNNKEGLADVGNDFVVVDKEAVSQEQLEVVAGGTVTEQVKAAEEIAAEIVSEPEKVKLEAEGASQPKEEITPEEIAQAKAEDVAKQVAEPEIVSEVVESAEVPAPEKVEEVVEVSQEKSPELQLLEDKVTETPAAAESNVILEEKKAESVVEAPVVTEPEIVSETQKEGELSLPVSNPELESLTASVPEAQKIEESSEPASSLVQESKVSEKEPEIKPVSETEVAAAPEITQEVQKVEQLAEPPSSLGSEPQSSEKEQIVEIVPEVPTSVVPEVAKDVQKLQEPAEAPTSLVLEARAIEKEEKIEIVPEVTQPETVPEKVQAEPEPVSKKEQAEVVPEVVQREAVAEVPQEAPKAEERVEATSSPAITEPVAEVSAEPESKKEEPKDESSTVQESTTAELEQKAETVAQEPEIVQESQNLKENASEVAAVAVVEEKKPESIAQEKSLETLAPEEEKKADAVVEGGVTVEEKLPEVQAAPEEPKVEALVPESQSGAPEPAISQEEKTATGNNAQSEAAPAKVEVPEVQEQAKPESTTDVEEKKKAENLETTLPEKKLEINPNPGPSHNPGNPSESHNPGNPNPSGSNPGNPNGKQDKKGEKKGVITKILEFVGVAPKQKKSRDESGETSKSIFYDTEAEKPSESQTDPAKPSEAPLEPEKSENLTEEPARRLSIPHVPPTLIETSFVSAPVPSEDSPVPASSETIDEILKATDLSSISEQIPIVQSQQEDPTGEEVVQELIQIAEEASAKLAAEESSETIESLTGKLILLTDGLKELVEPEIKEEAGLSEEDTLEISKVVAETFEKIISVLEDPAAYIEEEKKRSPSPRVVIKEIEAIPETSVVSPTPPTSPEDVPKPKKDVKLLLVDEAIPETPPVVEKDDVEKKTPIFLENNLIVDNQLIDTESLLSDINDIIDEAKNYVENQFSLECSTGEVNGEEEFEGLKVEGVKAGESVGATKEPENDEVGSKLDETMGETQPIEKKVQFDEEIRIVAVVESESSDGRAEQSEIGVIDSLESNEDRSLAIRERVAEIVEAERLDDASKKSEQGTIEEIHPDEESEIQTEKPETVEAPQSTSQVITSEKFEQEVVEKIAKVENTAQTDEEIKTEPPLIKSEPQTEDEFEEAVEELPEENLIISGTLVIDALGRNRDKTPEEPPKPPEKIQVKQPEEIPEPEEPVYSNVQKIDSKLVITTPPPPPPPDTKFEVEEIKVTSEEERKKHKSQPSTSKLSGQILKAIPPPRRKAISEAKGIKSTGAIPKTKLDDSKIVSVVLEKPISESMSVDRTSTPPPVPPRRNKSKQRQPPLPPPKRKTKK